MAEAREKRLLKEQETLMYSTPERAQEWRAEVQERLTEVTAGDVRPGREVVAEAVAEEFAQHGYGVSLTQPWEHTQEEHAEAQELVNVAFASDLTTALKEARQSPNWPRNLDLFHDVLTTELYSLVQEHKLNQQPLVGWMLFAFGIALGALLASGVLLLLAR